MRKPVRVVTGLFLTLLGLTGLILPIMPGWVFLIPGLLILAEYYHPIRRLVEWAKRKAGHYGPTPPGGSALQ
ncbi:MAG: hypothetical protein IT158_19260 [Bryobacterales bacterium]|nr:hypothetical protein [Bryobacterales bacterium]